MTEPEKLICKYVYDFVNENWDNIDRNNCELTQTKEEFLEELKTNKETAVWVIMEVASWSMDKKYLQEIFVKETQDLDFTVIDLNGTYLKLFYKTPFSECEISFAEKKTKTVEYWT